MSDAVAGWLEARTPPPVLDVGRWTKEAPIGGSSLARVLTYAGRAALDEALARPGRVRASAFALLGADALITYACEAALEENDPEEELRWILERVSAR